MRRMVVWSSVAMLFLPDNQGVQLNSQVEIIVEEATARQLIPFVRRLGATGVLTYPVLIEC